MTTRTYRMAVLRTPHYFPPSRKRVVVDLSEQTITTTYIPLEKVFLWGEKTLGPKQIIHELEKQAA